MTGLALHLVAIFAAVAFATSLVVAGLARVSRRGAAALDPRTRAAVALVGLSAPLVVGLVVVGAVAMPHQWLGHVDHCLDHPGHLHLCPVHGAPTPHPAVLAFMVAALLWMGRRLADALRRGARAGRALRRVLAAAAPRDELRVIAGDLPVAFTAGLARPVVVISEGVLAQPGRWRAVVEHERAHAARRDPLTRWLADALAAFHAPGLAASLIVALRDAQELAADDDAAAAVGSRLEVAEALVDWLRWTHATHDAVLGFHDGPFAARVRRLLGAPSVLRGPSPRAVAAAGLAGAAALALAAPSLHHAVETALGLLLH